MKEALNNWFRIIKNQLIYLNNKYIKRSLTHNFRMLFFSRITLNSGTQLLGIFLPIFLYEFFGLNIFWVISYYLINDFIFLSLMAAGCSYFINKFGINKSLQISIFFGALHYASFFLIDYFLLPNISVFSFSNILWLIPAIFFSTLFKLSHWIPYHTCISTLTDQNIRRSQFSLLEATILSTGAIMPFVAGTILNYLSYSYLFIISLSIYLLSLLFFSKLPKIRESFSWTYRETWQKTFCRKVRLNLLAYIGEGAESGIKIVIWPIFIWQILEGNYLQVGSISALIIIMSIIFQIALGNILDKSKDRKFWLNYSSLFMAIIWVLKASIVNIYQIFVYSTIYNTIRIFTRTSLLPTHYDIASDQGTLGDEYNLIREKGVILGRVISGLLILLIVFFFPINYVFYLAAFFSLFFVFIRRGLLMH
jgi:MFS family permease